MAPYYSESSFNMDSQKDSRRGENTDPVLEISVHIVREVYRIPQWYRFQPGELYRLASFIAYDGRVDAPFARELDCSVRHECLCFFCKPPAIAQIKGRKKTAEEIPLLANSIREREARERRERPPPQPAPRPVTPPPVVPLSPETVDSPSRYARQSIYSNTYQPPQATPLAEILAAVARVAAAVPLPVINGQQPHSQPPQHVPFDPHYSGGFDPNFLINRVALRRADQPSDLPTVNTQQSRGNLQNTLNEHYGHPTVSVDDPGFVPPGYTYRTRAPSSPQPGPSGYRPPRRPRAPDTDSDSEDQPSNRPRYDYTF